VTVADDFDLIVFDFDGTLCDSADVKTDAFYLLYLDDEGAEFAQRVKEYHLANAGVSRFDKIRHIETAMLGRDVDEQRITTVAARFGEIVEAQVIAAPLFDGVLETLEGLAERVTLAVASATPTEELRRIVDAKGLTRFFAVVEGSPRSKGEIVAGFVDAFGVAPQRTLMVGDQPSDLVAAEVAGTRFATVVATADGTWRAAATDSMRTFDWLDALKSVASRSEERNT
jgi:phosphoglycolate phosphatase-like HAD superfamily hydrolase